MNILKSFAAGAGITSALIAAQAQAQQWTTTGNNGSVSASRTYLQNRATVINSATTPTDLPTPNPNANVVVALKGSASTVSVTLLNKLSDGTVVGSQTVNVSNAVTPTVVTFTAPLTFDAIAVSATAGFTGTNNVSATVVQSQ